MKGFESCPIAAENPAAMRTLKPAKSKASMIGDHTQKKEGKKRKRQNLVVDDFGNILESDIENAGRETIWLLLGA